MYHVVPEVCPTRVRGRSRAEAGQGTSGAGSPSSEGDGRPNSLASPQSMTTVSPWAPSMILPGVRSRWMIPRPWA